MKIAILTPLQEELAFLPTGLEKFGLKRRDLKLGGKDLFEFSEKYFVEFRGITKAANHTTMEDFEVNLEIAMGILLR